MSEDAHVSGDPGPSTTWPEALCDLAQRHGCTVVSLRFVETLGDWADLVEANEGVLSSEDARALVTNLRRCGVWGRVECVL